jgi:repressor LexA
MLTPREQDVLRVIQLHFLRHGEAPLMREIAGALGVTSKSGVHRHLQALEQKGFLTLTARHRGIELTDTAPPGSLPLLGKIAAGRPIEAIPGQDEINLVELMAGPNRYVLRVKGDSMIDAGILDGDMVVIEKRERARNNEIVVALIDKNEATLKTLRHNQNGTITLLPANTRLKPSTYPADRVTVQGVVIGQIRDYR